MKGQAKKDFEKWYLDQFQKKTYKTISNLGGDKAIMLNWFSLSYSHRYGVIVDWFDSVGIYVEVLKTFNTKIDWYYCINDLALSRNSHPPIKTRHQARQKAIEKAVEIYNKR